jgi:hypothetical protein
MASSPLPSPPKEERGATTALSLIRTDLHMHFQRREQRKQRQKQMPANGLPVMPIASAGYLPGSQSRIFGLDPLRDPD